MRAHQINYGNVLEHYILGETLGTGAFGKVKKATHDLTKTEVAIKIINKRKVKLQKMNIKVKREIRFLKYFNHPNIIKLYEVLDTTTDIFVVMEYANGQELFELIAQNGKMEEYEAKHYFRQIVEGVSYIHQNLVAHRDLKPENILITQQKQVKIADFGLSNLMKDGKFLQTSCGSPNYASPEVVSARKYCGSEVDVWSCGVILYALLAGSLPFEDDVIPKLFNQIREADYDIPPYFSPLARDLIKRIFQPNQLNRIKFHQLKFHPWLLDIQSIPNEPEIFGHMKYCQYQMEINEIVYNQMIQKCGDKISQLKYNDKKVRESIRFRKDFSFVVIYELLLDEYTNRKYYKENIEKDIKNIKNQCNIEIEYKQQQQNSNENQHFQEKCSMNEIFFRNKLENTANIIADKILQNEINTKQHIFPESDHYIFGIQYKQPPQRIMTAIYDALSQLDTAINIKASSYKIKCYYNILKKQQSIYSEQMELESEERPYLKNQPRRPSLFKKKIMEQHIEPIKIGQGKHYTSEKHIVQQQKKTSKDDRYSKQNFVFNIQLYKIPNSEFHLIDCQLSQGHPILFFEYYSMFINLLTVILEEQFQNQLQQQK